MTHLLQIGVVRVVVDDVDGGCRAKTVRYMAGAHDPETGDPEEAPQVQNQNLSYHLTFERPWLALFFITFQIL